MKKQFILAVGIFMLALPVWGASKVAVKSDRSALEHSIYLANDQEIAGLALALRFADKGDDVSIDSVSFDGTRLQNIELKEAIVDNVEKTILVYGIVLQENHIVSGEGPIVKLSFTGKDLDKIKLTPTTIERQEGITLVSPEAKEVSYEFSGDITKSASFNLPQNFHLSQNYPNPFNASTQIRYTLSQDAHVRLEIFNVLGQRVKVLVDEFQTAGYRQILWDGRNERGDQVSSGVYLYRIDAGDYNEVRKMSLLK